MRHLISIVLVLVGIIHLLPLSGLLGAERLQALYGVSLQDPTLLVLLRHRAVLFGMLGIFMLAAAALPKLQLTAIITGFVSVGSFLCLALAGDGHTGQLARVVTVDWVALALLSLALAAFLIQWLPNYRNDPA